MFKFLFTDTKINSRLFLETIKLLLRILAARPLQTVVVWMVMEIVLLKEIGTRLQRMMNRYASGSIYVSLALLLVLPIPPFQLSNRGMRMGAGLGFRAPVW